MRNAIQLFSVTTKKCMANRWKLLALLCIIIFSSCFKLFDRDYNSDPPYEPVRFAWKPIYSVDTSYIKVTYQNSSEPVKNAGKIYVYGNYIFQADLGAGIHVIDNSNPAEAKRIGFLEVRGCEEIAIKGSYLYTNNYYDLITIDISRPEQASVVSRTKNAFYAANATVFHTWEVPPDTGWYVCPNLYNDSILVDWVKDSVYAQCLTRN